MQDYLNLSSIAVLIALLVYFRKEQRDIDVLCDKKEITPSDYSLLVKHLPKKPFNPNIKSDL